MSRNVRKHTFGHAQRRIRPRGYKTFFILNSAEHELYFADKFWQILTFFLNFFHAQLSWACSAELSMKKVLIVGILAHLNYAQDELLWSLFVRRPSVRPCVRPCVRPLTFSNDFSSEAAEPILLKFQMEPLRLEELKNAKMVAARWPRWPPCPYIVKSFKNLLLQNQECLGAESLHKSSGTRGLPKLLK